MKKIITFLLIFTIIITGCGKQKEIDNNENTENHNEQQYYDASRINSNENYTLESATKKFSFTLTYHEYQENDGFTYPVLKDVIYSYTGNNEKVSFTDYNAGQYIFKYNIAEDDSLNYIYFRASQFEKDKYKQQIEELDDRTIISEEENYVFYSNNIYAADSGIWYYITKFLDNGKGVEVEFYNSIYSQRSEELVYEALKAVIDSVEEDNGEPILQDKIVSMANFKNQHIGSYKYITDIKPYSQIITLVKDYENLKISFSTGYYSQSGWQVLSSDPYITVNNQKVYKAVVNGLPQYYEYSGYGDPELTIELKADGTLEGLNQILNKFYK